MKTVFGQLLSEDGLAYTQELVQGPTRPELRTRGWRTPAGGIRREQRPDIYVDREHDGRPVGRVVHLEKHDGDLWCVAEVDDTVSENVHVQVGDDVVPVPHPLFFSAEAWRDEHDSDVVLRSVALTTNPARAGARPIRVMDGGLRERGSWHLTYWERQLLGGAYETRLRRRARSPLVVTGIDGYTVLPGRHGYDLVLDDELDAVAAVPAAPWRRRRGSILDVR